MGLMDMELSYSRVYAENLQRLKQHIDAISKLKNIDLEKNEITCSILLRLKAFYDYQNEIKLVLNQETAPPAAYFFVETIAFFIQAVLRTRKSSLNLHCEKQIRNEREVVKPDISIWKENEVLSVIECKTQLGWNRDKWKEDFERRREKLRDRYPHLKSYLVVATSRNWPGFGGDPDVGRRFFCLSKVWPTDIDRADPARSILNPIEPLLLQILELN